MIFMKAHNDNCTSLLKNRYMPWYIKDKPDFGKVRDFIGLSKEHFQDILGVPENTIQSDGEVALSKPLQDYLIEIVHLCELVANNFKGDLLKTEVWFNLKNPLLGNVTPVFMIKCGLHKELQKFILDSMNYDLC